MGFLQDTLQDLVKEHPEMRVTPPAPAEKTREQIAAERARARAAEAFENALHGGGGIGGLLPSPLVSSDAVAAELEQMTAEDERTREASERKASLDAADAELAEAKAAMAQIRAELAAEERRVKAEMNTGARIAHEARAQISGGSEGLERMVGNAVDRALRKAEKKARKRAARGE